MEATSASLKVVGRAQRVPVQADGARTSGAGDQLSGNSNSTDVRACASSVTQQWSAVDAKRPFPTGSAAASRPLAPGPRIAAKPPAAARPQRSIMHHVRPEAFEAAGGATPEPTPPAPHRPTLCLPPAVGAASLSPLDRQELALRAWLNGALCAAPTAEQEGAATDTLASLRLAARARGLLWRVYWRDQELRDGMQRLEERIDGGQLGIRNPDVVLRGVKELARLRSALAAYHPFWLRLGAEVAVGRTAEGQLDAFEQLLLATGLLQRHGGARTAAYWADLGRVVLKRVLVVVALLDRGAQSRLRGAPLLFRRGGRLRSSAAVLQEAAGALLGEAEVGRCLGRLGYKVAYSQHPRSEYDFSASNLAVDLRDGLRLCRLAEELARRTGLFEAAHFPAVRRPDRLHNVRLALEALQGAGLSLAGVRTARGEVALAPAEVVDGEREGTVCLLWRLVLRFQLPLLVEPASLEMEMDRLRQRAAEAAGGGAEVRCPAAALGGELAADAGASAGAVGALLKWVQAVAGQHGASAPDFGRAFADGSLFCLLIHHYMGDAHMPMRRVHFGTSPAAVEYQGAMHNFAAVRAAADALGGIPAVITGEEFFHEQGADERAVVLFTALLCRRLMEAHREDRAAMAIQRHFRRLRAHRPGTAREHLHSWIAAAAVVQRCVRAWLLRAAVRRAAQQQRRRVAAATAVQAAWRARPCRVQYLQIREGVALIQAAWKGKLARRAYFGATLAPKIAAAALQRHSQLAQGTVVARAARLQLARESSAAVSLQSAWRGHRCRAELSRRQAAATAIQAAFRGASWRRAYLRRRAAAVAIQSAFRGWAARRQFLEVRRAAVTLQRYTRGLLVRREAARRRGAALTIQRRMRAHLERRRRGAVDQVRRQMAALAQAMEQFAARTLAAKRIQAFYRGHCGRKEHRALLAQRAEELAKQAQREHAACSVIASWAPVFRDRGWFLRARRAAGVLQRWWRRELAARNAAATAIQKHVRAFLAVRRLQAAKRAALAIQAAYRGHAVHAGHPQRKRLGDIRARLRAANAAAASAPHVTFGARTARALEALAAAAARGHPLPLQALKELEHCTACSQACCDLVADGGAVAVLLAMLRTSGRDKSQAEQLRAALSVLGSVCRYERYVDELYRSCAADETLVALAELLQHHREKDEVFMAGATLLGRLVADTGRAQALGRLADVMQRLEGVARLLCHKRDASAVYLAKLEGQKGSDASARQATRALVMVKLQLAGLATVLAATGACDVDSLLGAEPAAPLQGKNMIVRSALAEIWSAAPGQPGQPANRR